MLTYLFALGGLGIVLALYISLASKVPNLQEGMWAIETKTKLPGMSMETTMRHTQILTKNDFVPAVVIPGYECDKYNDSEDGSSIGNFLFWSVNCEGQGGKLQGEGFLRFKKKRFKGSLSMRVIDPSPMKRFKAYVTGSHVQDLQ